MPHNDNNKFPSNRKNWRAQGIEPGERADDDPGAIHRNSKVAGGDIIVGAFVTMDSLPNVVLPVDNGQDGKLFAGISMIKKNVSGLDDEIIKDESQAPIAKRGYWAINIDVDNPPVSFVEVFIETVDAAKKGFLRASVTGALGLKREDGVELIEVGSDFAIVYLSGNAGAYTIVP